MNFDTVPFLNQLTWQRVIYFKRKPLIVIDESNFIIGSSSIIRGSKQVLVKVLLFQLHGRGNPQYDATPSFFPDSKNSIVRLSNEVTFVSEFFWKGGKSVY